MTNLDTWVLDHEAALRFGAFLSAFFLMALWEVLAARRKLSVSKGRRWLANLGLVVVDAAVVRVFFPAAAVGVALAARELEMGLFNKFSVPYPLAVAASVVALDLTVYLQHVMFHAVPVLWRLHMVHHADVDFDVTTGLRFHPIEILVSMLIKTGVIFLIGPPLIAVAIFEVILNGLAMFNHANVRIPRAIERPLRLLVVTPEMHRVHHSIDDAEYTTNFGFNLSLWDRAFGTYLAQPAAGHEGMTIGLPNFREDTWRPIHRLLIMPFNRRAVFGARCGAGRTRPTE
jgi:sterol desaturase/sphingolipid hydroxylase (fatty acid hydroxylase superfamily)